MIEVEDLTKDYGSRRSIDGLTFSVPAGEVLGFLGPNGAGKSTTMRILVGLARPTAGRARVGGFDVQRAHESVRGLLGYLPEQAPLYGDMTLGGFLEFMGGLKGLDRQLARRDVDRVLSLVNLQKEKPRLLRNLSKGTRQRAAIAQALLGDPKVLILDEPTVGLDPAQINDVRALIRSMQGERTVVLSTHILPEVEKTCSRIVIIAEGRIVTQGSASELVEKQPAAMEIVLRGDRTSALQILAKAGAGKPRVEPDGERMRVMVEPALDDAGRAALVRALVDGGVLVLELRVIRPQLEDVFLKAIGRERKP